MAEETMSLLSGQKPVLRFAPSPNGRLHLGHALSAILNHDMAKAMAGRFLLRIEDIDLARCTDELEQGIYEDLAWLGLDWEMPVRRQSDHFDVYRKGLDKLIAMRVAYPSFMSRGDVKAFAADYEAGGNIWPRDPDGALHYPALDKQRPEHEVSPLLSSGKKYAWRLDMDKALALLETPLQWRETGRGSDEMIDADPAAWGDVVLSRSDAPSSYHLSVVMDDAVQGITHVVRGMDLYHATSVHRLLQELLGLPAPEYHHHRLILDDTGNKLSKSRGSASLQVLREQGLAASDIRGLLGI
ncbi:tRNA glutamyl-Q(34) synthetase GluQRS [Agrobacterium vaccinii]|uniref:tRNA glutamyl-Q(34) synthetase GluQRS n=1 Tax=Agrobacterium vaccinii TaxID=2735528 RepID=UPI001E56E699|nr:tRNA glutamyl-Q(34) synthetase GluQRS [Agrobacterium vaccinii]UHS59062.1 tRNA glutamyl-Q(34) synthetase GluQRS [Agrobacterium vaccinii]